MAVQKIDYENKIGLQNDKNVPNKNKVTDEDMNQIKSKVNNNADELSTAQQNIKDLQAGQGTASGDIASLKNRVTTLEGDNKKNKQDIANKVDKVEGKGLSTEDYTTAEKQKLAGLNNYDDTEIKQDIQDLKDDVSGIKSEQETQNDLLERTQSALINITTEKSSSINVQDCSNLPAKMNVFGISEQKTRSGKNKLKLINSNNTSAGLNWQTTEDEVKISGTATSGYSSSNEFECPTIPAGTYKFLAGEVSNLTYRIWLYNNQNQLIKYPASGEEFTLTEDVVKYRLIFDNLTTGNTYNASFKPMILESTEEDESFEQYGASPSPEYKSDIENVEGNVDITVCNKNLFNCLKWLKMNHSAGYPVAITDNTNTAIEIIKETKNSIKYNQKSAYYGVLSEYIPVKKGQIFTLSFNYININRLFVTQYDKDKTRIKELNNTGNVNTTTFTVEQDGFITIAFSYSNATPNENTIEITNIQLEVGTVKTDYIENEQQTITFPLQEGQKLYKGDYLADDGIHHVRKQKLITGEEALWTYYSANDIWARPYVQIDDKKIGESNNTANALCNKAKSISWEDMAAGLNEYAVFTYEGDRRINISVKKEDLKTQDIDGVKKYFQENNMVVEYNLEEEEIEPYTPEQQEAYNQLQNVLPYKPVTNVFTDKALLEFKYVADTQTWVVNEIKPLKEQLNTINQLLSTTGTSATLLDNLQKDLESEVL